jgi:nucleoside phosphorylase
MSHLPTAGVLVAIPREFEAVRDRLDDIELDPRGGETFHVGRLQLENSTWRIVVKETGQGNVSSSQAVSDLVQHFDLDIALLVGTAGGLKDVIPGDVIAATRMKGYHRGVENEEFKPRTRSPEATRTAIECARSLAQDNSWVKHCSFTECTASHDAHTGAVASGEAVVKSDESVVYKRIAQHQSACIGVEMEGYGFYEAAQRKELPKLAIRGVFDYVQAGEGYDDERSLTKSEIEEEGYKGFASEHASAFMMAFLDRYPRYRDQLDAVTVETDGESEDSSTSQVATGEHQFVTDAGLADGLLRGAVELPSGICSAEQSVIGDSSVIELEMSDGYPGIGVVCKDVATPATVRDVEDARAEFTPDGPLQPTSVILSPTITDKAREMLQNYQSQYIKLSGDYNSE